MSNVVVIKVKRTKAGASIPFDKIYLFTKEDEHLISDIFGYALVFPMSESLIDKLIELLPAKHSHYKQLRDDAAVNVAVNTQGKKLSPWWEDTYIQPYGLRERLVVVPVLTGALRGKLHPRYLANKYWYLRRSGGRRRRYLPIANNPTGPAISDMAYLATPLEGQDGKITPICSICPRQLQQLQGECYPGQSVCLSALDFNSIGVGKEITDDMSIEEEQV